MASESSSLPQRIVSGVFYRLARSYVRSKKPLIIAVGGSVGKTSTKLVLAELLATEKRVSYMDDSYNNGIGLYLSVFNQKVPTNAMSPLGWAKTLARAIQTFFKAGPEILILEYGIDHPGDMDDMTAFIQPDIGFLTAVTPEHMEYMKTIELVAEEEIKLLSSAKQFGIVNAVDVDSRFLTSLTTPVHSYGYSDSDAQYTVRSWTNKGALVDFRLEEMQLTDVLVHFISEPLIRQLTGAALLAKKLGVSKEGICRGLETAQPAASRMRLFEGKQNSVIIDDTTNFSPNAGIEALKSLKRLEANRHIAILGNMHELGEYADKGFSEVAKEFTGLDMIVLVGDISVEHFLPLATKQGFKKDETIFICPDAPSAGIFLRDQIQDSDAILVKGPFGGFYLEEAVKKLLKNPADSKYLTRQSDFWQRKKRQQFGNLLDA
ncbi:UDP-N-acetylmuramoyl-tripeptide--D-alanyl-D-alanine ligase [compost metagenome]